MVMISSPLAEQVGFVGLQVFVILVMHPQASCLLFYHVEAYLFILRVVYESESDRADQVLKKVHPPKVLMSSSTSVI